MKEVIKRSELRELVRIITKQVLREFQNIDPTSNSSVHDTSNSTSPDRQKDDNNADVTNPVDQKHDIEQKAKDTELKRKSEESEYKRNQQKVQQYRNSIKPAIKREQDALKAQLRSI